MITSAELNHIISSFGHLMPELIVVSGIILLLLVDLIFKQSVRRFLPHLTIVVLFATAFALLQQHPNTENGAFSIFQGMLSLTLQTVFFRLIFVFAGLMCVHFINASWRFRVEQLQGSEFYVLLLSVVLGLHFMVMSVNLLMTYLSLEFVAISSYVLTFFRNDAKGKEAALKYLVYGAVSSAIMLYGISLVYGFAGGLNYSALGTMVDVPTLGMIGIFFTIAGFLFKISAVPFHFWTPDVYQGAPTPVAAFFSVAPKIGGLVVLLYFARSFISGEFPWVELLSVIAILTILVGNLVALWQHNVKRLLAYSSIGHGGFLLIALVSYLDGAQSSEAATVSLMFYSVVYLFMNFAAFMLVDILMKGTNSTSVKDYAGLGKQQPLIAILIVVVMIGLTGIPPTAGFSAKLLVLTALAGTSSFSTNLLLWILLGTALAASVLSLVYYLRIPYYMFFKDNKHQSTITVSPSTKIFVALITLPVILIFFKMDWILNILLQFKL